MFKSFADKVNEAYDKGKNSNNLFIEAKDALEKMINNKDFNINYQFDNKKDIK